MKVYALSYILQKIIDRLGAMRLLRYMILQDEIGTDPFHFIFLEQLFVDTQLFSVHTDLVLSFFQKE